VIEIRSFEIKPSKLARVISLERDSEVEVQSIAIFIELIFRLELTSRVRHNTAWLVLEALGYKSKQGLLIWLSQVIQQTDLELLVSLKWHLGEDDIPLLLAQVELPAHLQL